MLPQTEPLFSLKLIQTISSCTPLSSTNSDLSNLIRFMDTFSHGPIIPNTSFTTSFNISHKYLFNPQDNGPIIPNISFNISYKYLSITQDNGPIILNISFTVPSMFPSVFVGYDLLSYLTNYVFMLISFQLIIAHLMYCAVQCFPVQPCPSLNLYNLLTDGKGWLF